MHGVDVPIGGGGGGPSGSRPAGVSAAPAGGERLLWPMLAVLGALGLHGAVAAGLSSYATYKKLHPDALAKAAPLEVAVVEKAPSPPPPRAEEPKPRPKPVPMKIARAQPRPPPPPSSALPPPSDSPPAPTTEAKVVTREPIRVLSGISFESTVTGGTFAAPVGNTLRGAPSRATPEPEQVKPYKAERYASSAQVNELPSVLNREAVDLRKFYPPDALKRDFEGEVVLRLLIDSDGSIAKAEVVTDPGQGLGQAAVRAVREYRFSPGKVNGVAVATTVPFVIKFVIN